MYQIKTENDEKRLTYCRICGKFSNYFVDIFKVDRNGKKLVEILSFCLKQTIHQGDGLPEIICLDCESKLIMAHKFHTLAASAQKKAELNLIMENGTCRICGKFSNCILDLFKIGGGGKQLVEMLSFCLKQVIHEDDVLPGIICLDCESNLITVYGFHRLCIENERQLRSPNKAAKKRVEIVYEAAGENEIKVEDEVMLPAKPPVVNAPKEKPKRYKYSHLRAYKYTCATCSKVCKDKTQLRYHIESTHDETYLVCHFENCNSTHKTKSSLRYHILKHSGETHTCNICKKSFFRVVDLSRHIRIHSDERNYVCTICQKAFRDHSTLSKHVKIHIGEKTHMCRFCGKSFLVASTLRTHERIHTGEKPYCCDFCSKKFTNSGGLHTHTRTHTGERPYKCQVCEMSFMQPNHLRQHQRIHTGEKPYFCNVCDSTFAQLGHLITHQKIHFRNSQPTTQDKTRSVSFQFFCAHCGKAYARKNTLKPHLIKCYEEHGFENRI